MDFELLTQLIKIGIYAIIVASCVYLTVAMEGLRRYLTVLFCISFSISIGVEVGVIIGQLKGEEGKYFAYWVTHCASGAFVILLAMDRWFFHRGYEVRCPKIRTTNNGLKNESGELGTSS